MNLAWLVLSSFVWVGLLSWVGGAIQSNARLGGDQRRTLWRAIALLAVAPWLATFVLALSRVFAPRWTAPEWTALAPEYSGAAFVEQGARAIQVAPAPLLPPIPLEVVVMLVLGAGWLVRTVVNVRAIGSLHSVLRATSPLKYSRAGLSRDRWSERLSLKVKPSLLASTADVSPFTCGVRSPIICMPEGLAERLGDQQLDLVVGHECMHVARRDAIWQPLERVVADLLWFNPFAWHIRRELDLARELSCDEAVLSVTGQHRAYASTLVDVARMSAGLPRGAPASSILSNPNGSNLHMRIQNVLSGSKRPAWIARAGVGLVVLIGAPLALAQVAGTAPHTSTRQVERPRDGGPIWGDDGVVRAGDALQVTAVTGNPADGYRVRFEQKGAGSSSSSCVGALGVLNDVSVNAGQTVVPGAVIGRGGQKGEISLRCATGGSLPSLADIPEAPEPPGSPRDVVPGDGTIRARFDGVVDSANRDNNGAFSLALSQTNAGEDVPACKMSASGLSELSVKDGQKVASGDVLGRSGDSTNVSISCTRTVSEDAPSPPTVPSRLSAPPVPPASPAVPAVPTRFNTPPALPAAPAPPSIWPAAIFTGPARVTSSFGERTDPFTKKTSFHSGVDIGAARGTPVHAPASAKVTFAGTKEGYGNVVEITAAHGYVLRFGQLDEINVKQGASVAPGDVVGLVGTSGARATGPHLHMEVYWNGSAYNPEAIEGLQLIPTI